MKIYMGYDPREALGTWVFQHSVMRRSKRINEFIPLAAMDFCGTNAFTYARFRAAQLSDYRGPLIIFADGADMICRVPIEEIEQYHQLDKAVSVVQRPDYVARTPKYIGTEMEAENKSYPRKNWTSVMLINPGHYGWKRINWDNRDPDYWMGLRFLKDTEIGELPNEWNRIVDEGDPIVGGKILHWTLGVPAIPAYRYTFGSSIWCEEVLHAMELP